MKSQSHRLAEGGRIDRATPLRFTFNGRRFGGFAGDTLASALVANRVSVVGRSVKYHRPRGIFSAGSEEPNAIVQLETGAHTLANARATRVELYDGLTATSVNCWPSAEYDFAASLGLFSRLLPAGFYYKTFKWPASLWMTYEAVIRRAAGLGRAPDGPDPDRYDKINVHCDVLVVGGGSAGLAAALAAGRTGARVILADEQNEFGGALLNGHDEIDGAPALDWTAEAVTRLGAMDEVRCLPRTTVFGYYHHNFLAALERVTDHLGPQDAGVLPRQRLWRIRAKRVVLATGAIERPLVFAGNDRPGVMLADAARTYVNRYAARPGRQAVLFANNDGAYRAALDLRAAGLRIAAIVDTRPVPTGDLPAEAESADIELIAGHAVVATHGRKRLSALEVMALGDGGGRISGAARRIPCDLLCVSGGWNPTTHLFSQSGGRLRFDAARTCFVPSETAQTTRPAGAASGTFALDDCLVEGRAAGAAAAADTGFRARGRTAKASGATVTAEEAPGGYGVVPAPGHPEGGPKHFVDLQNDVTAADIALAAREGYGSVEHLKRYTTLGMGTDQGKTANVAGLAILARLGGTDVAETGHTTFRSPYTPVTFGALAGRDVGALSDVVRRTPMHHWHERAGARFEDVGQWRRPWYYRRAGEDMAGAVKRECLAARHSVGILDATTLGKIDIQGPDAAELLNRVYTNAWSKLEVGRCRYGLMLNEDGMVMDDGVTARLGQHHYLMTTTTGNAARVLAWLEEWLQTEWPELRVYVASVTEQWATMTLCGPNARRLLAEFIGDVDLAAGAFPFMAWRAATVGGVAARLFRVSFTGELSFEINVPARYGLGLWTAFMNAGEKYGITPFGTEAMHVLRAEKGYIIVGQETDGTVTPADLGMDWIVSSKKDFLGRRSLSRSDTARPDRKQLVGLETEDAALVLPEGAHVVENSGQVPPVPMSGHVTSSYYSANLGRSIALALIKDGRKRMGENVRVALEDCAARAVIRDPVFFDVQGGRLHG